MAKTNSVSQRQIEIYRYIKTHQPVEQSKIVKAFESYYSNKESARVNISILLNKIRRSGTINVKQKKNQQVGFLQANIWSIKQ